ncbi:MAG: ribonuclease HII, partial [Candidatus Bathyarchaeota archaeon B63]
VDERDVKKIEALGVRDSKTLTPSRRRRLAEEILKVVRDHCIVELQPAEIDRVVKTGRKLHRLNRLEARAMAEVISRLRPDIAYIDASDVLPERFSRHVEEELSFNVKIVSEHRADKTYPVVSAASIIAKVERDRAIDDLRRRYGNLGSGYASDKRTIKFLEEWMRRHGDLPDFVRRSWAPARRIKMAYDESQMRL